MKSETVGGMVVAVTLALVAASLLSVWLLRDFLRELALIVLGGLTLAAIIAASALPVRAWRKNDAQPVIEHHYHDGTRTVEKIHTIDGRAPATTDVKLLQLPPAGMQNVYPELLRGAFRAGALAAPEQSEAPGLPLRRMDLADADSDPDAWSGELRP